MTSDKNIKERILKIQNDLGLTASGMSKLMCITRNTYYKKINDNEPGHSFNEENYNKLIHRLIEYVDRLRK